MRRSEVSIVVEEEAREPEEHLISVTRIVLTLAGQLFVLSLDQSHRYAVSALLALYSAYAIWVHIGMRRQERRALQINPYDYWVDVAWCMTLVGITGSTSHTYFYSCLFPIFIASFRHGFASGLRTSISCVTSLIAIDCFRVYFLVQPYEPYRSVAQTASVFVLGYLMAHWGDSEITLKRRLELLQEVTSSSNPRFGVDRTLGSILDRLKQFYGARSCLLVTKDPQGFGLRSSDLSDPGASVKAEAVSSEFGSRLLDLPPEYAVVHNARSENWWHMGRSCQTLDIELNRITRQNSETCEKLAGTLDAKSFVTVPVHYSDNKARLYLESDKYAFRPSDMRFLLELIDHVNPIIENIELVERLAGNAAEEERSRIARDVHDSIIQPYIGLQIGLTAIGKKTRVDCPELAGQIEQLITLAQHGIDDLRRYVAGLKDGGSEGGLLPAMRHFTKKFTAATGITVRLDIEGNVHANKRLAAETFQMMAEGLSNIRKHTRATAAVVRLACYNGSLRLEISEHDSRNKHASAFTPGSITERATALGGKVHVRSLPAGGSAVVVDIPL